MVKKIGLISIQYIKITLTPRTHMHRIMIILNCIPVSIIKACRYILGVIEENKTFVTFMIHSYDTQDNGDNYNMVIITTCKLVLVYSY